MSQLMTRGSGPTALAPPGNRAVPSLAPDARPIVQRDRVANEWTPPKAVEGWAKVGTDYMPRDLDEALRGRIPVFPKGGDVRRALAGERPRLLDVLSTEELDQWQAHIDYTAALQEHRKYVAGAMDAAGLDQHFTERADYRRWRRKLDAALPPVPKFQGDAMMLPVGRFLDPEIFKVDFDVEAKLRFRRWAVEQLSSSPIEIRLIDPFREDMRFVNQMLPTAGMLTADGLFSIFPDDYKRMVSNRPELVQLHELVGQLESLHAEVDPDFQNRIEKNEKYSGGLAFVRKWSEWLGDGDATMPDAAEWNGPYYGNLKPGAKLLREGKVELAIPLVARAMSTMPAVADQYAAYEARIQSGGRVAIKWLGRIKTVGSIAATVAAGPLGSVWKIAAVAGAYSGTQNLAQQGAEYGLGQRTSIDLGAAAKDAAIASTMAMIGGPLQAKFQSRITEYFVEKGVLGAAGVEASVLQSRVSSVLAGATSAVYTTPVQQVMSHIVNGTVMPASVEEWCNLVVEEAVKSGVMTGLTDKVNHDLAVERAKSATTEAVPTAEPTPGARLQAKNEAKGSELLALGAKAVKEGQAPPPRGPVEPGTYDPKSQSPHDPAHTADPTYESGLQSKDAMARVAHDTYVLSQQRITGAKTAEAQIKLTANRIMDIIASELPHGMPPPRIVVKAEPGGRPGYYDGAANVIHVNPEAYTTKQGPGEVPTFDAANEGYTQLLGLIYHESRHYEQYVQAMRVKAGTMLDVPVVQRGKDIAALTGINKELAASAAERPIDPTDTSPEAKLGREIWAETFEPGERRDLRDFGQEVNKKQGEMRREVDQLVEDAVRLGGKTDPQGKAVFDAALALSKRLDAGLKQYEKLVEEIDARRTEFGAAELFQRVTNLQLELNSARIQLKAAMREYAAKTPVDKIDATSSEVAQLYQHLEQVERQMQALAALAPKPRATVGATR